MKLKFWDVLQVVGAICSIIGIVQITSSRIDTAVVYCLIVIGTLTVIISSVLARRPTPVTVSRAQMIQIGKNLITGAKRKVVLFGGDMSWADDYEGAKITSEGKKVVIVCAKSNGHKVRRNKAILESCDSDFLELEVDLGLRAMIIDPDHIEDSILFLVKRTLKPSKISVSNGEKGTSQLYEYKAKVYTNYSEPVPLEAMIKIYESIQDGNR